MDSCIHPEELERALRALRNGKDPAGVIESLSRRLTNKLLHPATAAIVVGDDVVSRPVQVVKLPAL